MPLLRLFGHPVLERNGSRTPIGVPPKAVALLALVAAHHTRPLSREWLGQSLWPDLDPGEARANLRRHFHLLAKNVADDLFVLNRHTAQWNAGSTCAVDSIRFEMMAEREPALAIQEYGGDLCSGLEEEALEPLRLRYRSAFETALRTVITQAREAGDDAALGMWLQRAVNYDPFDEAAVRQIMELRMRHGDRTGAIREFNALAQRLRSELLVEPEAETLALFAEITGADAGPGTPNNLPNSATTFVGREDYLSAIFDAVREFRIVTLTGTGGIGKSRLAVRAGFNLLPSYAGGVWFVALEQTSNESAIWEQLARILGLAHSDAPDRAVIATLQAPALLIFDTCEHVADAARAVAERLANESHARVLATSRRRLQAAGERVIEIGTLEIPPEEQHPEISPMRFAAYRLFIERATAVSPAFRVEPHQSRALVEVLRRTDGLPLAIELVASRANVLTIEGMRKRFAAAMRAAHRSPATARAQTIEDTIAWSYDLLDREQQCAFRRLSVFEGTFDVEDAERICGDLDDPVEALFELVDDSLVSIVPLGAEVRYRLLDTTRAFARQRLHDLGEERDAQLRHAEIFASYAQQLVPVPDNQFAGVLGSVIARMPNYLSALSTSASHGWPALGVRLLQGLVRFGLRHHFHHELLAGTLALLDTPAITDQQYALAARFGGMLAESCGRYTLGLELLQAAVERSRDGEDRDLLWESLSGVAIMAYHLGRYDECERGFLDLLERTERDGATTLHVKTLGRLGALYLAQARFEESIPLLESAAEELVELGELRQAATAIKNRATAAYYSGQHADAVVWAQRALDLSDTTRELGTQALALCLRASAYRELGQIEDALGSLLETAPLLERLNETSDLAEVLEDSASTLAACAHYRSAARLLGFAEALRARIGSPQNSGLQRYALRTRSLLEQELGSAFDVLRAAGAQESSEAIRRFAVDALKRAAKKDSEDTTSLS